jgi:hypothetical protein
MGAYSCGVGPSQEAGETTNLGRERIGTLSPPSFSRREGRCALTWIKQLRVGRRGAARGAGAAARVSIDAAGSGTPRAAAASAS